MRKLRQSIGGIVLLIILTAVATKVAQSAAPATAGVVSTTNAGSATADYEAAKIQWLGDAAVVSGAVQNTALLLAVVDLKRGQHTAANTSGYGAAIAAITDFAAIPLTSVTPAENALAHTDIATVNKFFDLPHSTWTRGCIASGPGIKAAARAWSAEPGSTSHGTLTRPLKTAANDLSRAIHTDTGDRSCYPAAIADLTSLESATDSEVAASSKNWTFDAYTPASLVGSQIAYLNTFFLEAGAPNTVLDER